MKFTGEQLFNEWMRESNRFPIGSMWDALAARINAMLEEEHDDRATHHRNCEYRKGGEKCTCGPTG